VSLILSIRLLLTAIFDVVHLEIVDDVAICRRSAVLGNRQESAAGGWVGERWFVRSHSLAWLGDRETKTQAVSWGKRSLEASRQGQR
jgi:hypothetical protein